MTYIRSITLASLLVIAFTACEKTISLDPEQADTKVVIEGLVTDYPGYQYVKLSRSVDFYSSGKTPRITDATVTVEDDLGNVTVFEHNPNDHADSAGYYKPVSGFIGEVGRTYKLSVMADGALYEAEDRLHRIEPIDSLSYQVNEDELDDPDRDTEQYYEVLLYTTEPQETEDYYLFNFYRNDSLVVDSPGDIYYADDTAIGEDIDGIASPVFFAVGDTARVEALSLSRKGFIFYNDLFNLVNNDGGMYGPPPANARTNLSNGALGFFQASAVSVKGIRVE